MKINKNLKQYYKDVLIEAVQIDSVEEPSVAMFPDDMGRPMPDFTPPTLPTWKPAGNQQRTPSNPSTPENPTDVPPSGSQEFPPGLEGYRYVRNEDGTFTIWKKDANGIWRVHQENVPNLGEFYRDTTAPNGSETVPQWDNPDHRVVVDPGPPRTITVYYYDRNVVPPVWMPIGDGHAFPGSGQIPWHLLDPDSGWPWHLPETPIIIPNPNGGGYLVQPRYNGDPNFVEIWRWQNGEWVRQVVPSHALTQPPYNIDPQFLSPYNIPSATNPTSYPTLYPPSDGWTIVPGAGDPPQPLFISPDGTYHYWGPNGLTPLPGNPGPLPPNVIPIPWGNQGIPNHFYPSHQIPYVFPPYTPNGMWPPTWFTPDNQWRNPPKPSGLPAPEITPDVPRRPNVQTHDPMNPGRMLSQYYYPNGYDPYSYGG